MYLTDRLGKLIHRCESTMDGMKFLTRVENITDRDFVLWNSGDKVLGVYRYDGEWRFYWLDFNHSRGLSS